jgi:polyisoprenoid-binding protein YceI
MLPPMLTGHSWLAALLALSAIFWHASSHATEFTLDPTRTLVSFEMRSLGTTQRGEFDRAAGTVTLDSTEERGELDIVIDARSLKAGSEATARFVRGPSMLNTAAHPEIAYRAHRIVFAAGRPTRIEGELTLLGVTRAVALDVSNYDCTGHLDQRCTMVASAHVKRSAFGMTRYMMFASDDVKLAIQAEGVSRSTAGCPLVESGQGPFDNAVKRRDFCRLTRS